LFATEENGSQKTTVVFFIYIFMSFFNGNKFFFKNFLLVSNVKLWEIYDKKRKKLEQNVHMRKRRQKVHWFYFPPGYIYRANCISKLMIPTFKPHTSQCSGSVRFLHGFGSSSAVSDCQQTQLFHNHVTDTKFLSIPIKATGGVWLFL
jgi:hypothetical protein